MAQESGDQKSMIQAVGDLVNSCTFGKIDANNSPTFDIEYIFLKIRSKSVGETVELTVTCPDDEKTKVPVKLKLDDIKVLTDVTHRSEIDVTDTIKIAFRYPLLNDTMNLDSGNSVDAPFKMINSCVESIHYGDDIYQKVDITEKDLEEFIDQLTGEQFENIMNFFSTMPKLRHVIQVTNPKTNVKSEVVLEGLQSFLV